MTINEIIKQYSTSLDDIDKRMIDERVAVKGIDAYLKQQLIYLDCSRIINGARMMQTIGYPYRRDISSYLYALNKCYNDYPLDDNEKEEYSYYITKLVDLHEANLRYEETNPPIWYGGKKAKDKWNKEHNKPIRKIREQTFPGMCKEFAIKEKLKLLNANFDKFTFKLKPSKKDE